jgi:hypothetical protein
LGHREQERGGPHRGRRSPKPRSRVRTRLSAGGNRIRTIGPASGARCGLRRRRATASAAGATTRSRSSHETPRWRETDSNPRSLSEGQCWKGRTNRLDELGGYSSRGTEGSLPDGHRWDSPPKIKFAPDSPLEGRRMRRSRPL